MYVPTYFLRCHTSVLAHDIINNNTRPLTVSIIGLCNNKSIPLNTYYRRLCVQVFNPMYKYNDTYHQKQQDIWYSRIYFQYVCSNLSTHYCDIADDFQTLKIPNQLSDFPKDLPDDLRQHLLY